MQKTIRVAGLAAAIAVIALAGGSQAQTPPAATPPQPPQFPNMTFFVTSIGGPQGADYGGLEGADRHCQTLAAMTDCNRGLSPDDLCGNSFSGQACDRLTGQCVPELGSYAPTDRAQPNGVCKMDGTRGCPFPLLCSPRVGSIPEGIPSFDGVCLPDVKDPAY